MIATMDEGGVITLQAESSVEAYALRQWSREALVPISDLARGEQCYWLGSKLLTIAEVSAPAHGDGKGGA